MAWMRVRLPYFVMGLLLGYILQHWGFMLYTAYPNNW